MCSYLDERMPVCDGFAWVSQHFIPVFSSQTLGIITYSAYTDDLIVTYTVKRNSEILCLLRKTTSLQKYCSKKNMSVLAGFQTGHVCSSPNPNPSNTGSFAFITNEHNSIYCVFFNIIWWYYAKQSEQNLYLLYLLHFLLSYCSDALAYCSKLCSSAFIFLYFI